MIYFCIVYDVIIYIGIAMDGPQFKAARVWAGLTHLELSKAAKVGIATVRRVETSKSLDAFRFGTLQKIINTLKEYGVEIDEEGSNLVLRKHK